MLEYDLAALMSAFPPVAQDELPSRERMAVSDDYELETADSLGLSFDAPLRTLIEKPTGKDRSADVMACAAMMVRMGYDDAVILMSEFKSGVARFRPPLLA